MNYILSLITLWSLIFAALAQAAETRNCQEALIAGGREWESTRYSPLQHIHPGYSTTAEKIYFYYAIHGLEIFIEQGPYGGSHWGANRPNKFVLKYDPEFFLPFSYFRIMFGNEPIEVRLEAAKDGDFKDYFSETSLLGGPGNSADEIMQVFIPTQAGAKPFDLTKGVHMLISRQSGRVFGYGRKSSNCVVNVLRDCWLELRTNAHVRSKGYGVWYNSNSGMPLPSFAEEKK